MDLEQNPLEIKRLAGMHDSANWRFRSFLKQLDWDPREIDALVHQLHRKVAAVIDCTRCANCCREIYPVLLPKDVQRLAAGLGLPVEAVHARYLIAGKAPDTFLFNRLPCPLLQENLCTVYAHRPSDCRSFPHLHKKHFTSRLIGVVQNCEVCPIVYHVYERLKRVLWRRTR